AAAPVPPSAPSSLSPAALESMPVLAPVGFLAGSPLETLSPAPVALGGGSPGPGALLMAVPPAGSTPGEGTPGTPTPPPAVPEPSTWVSLLTGLAILSASLRHARRRQAQAAPSSAG